MRKAEEVLRAYIPQLSNQSALDYFSLFSSWAELLGDEMQDISAHSEPVDVRNGSLIVFVDHPGWMQKLMFRKKRILSLLAKRYPELGISNLFIQKVRDDEFIRRREARLAAGNQEASLEPEFSGSGEKAPTENVNLQKVEKPEATENRELKEPDGEFAETIRRLKKMIGDS